MHSYSIDTGIRAKVHVVLALIAVSLPTFVEAARSLVGLPQGISFSVSFGAAYGVMFFVFDRWVWRLASKVIGVPDLNAVWDAKGRSSYGTQEGDPPFEYDMTVTIRQTFSQVEVFTETGNSTSRSMMASMNTQHAVPIFRYAFENIPRSVANEELQRHAGLTELRIDSAKEMSGDYFSGKHRLRYGELTLTKRDKDGDH